MPQPDMTKVLESLKETYAKAHQTGEDLRRAATITTGTGLNAIDLKPVADIMQPEFTPWRNNTPRITGAIGDSSTWKAIRRINPNGMGTSVPEGERGSVVDLEEIDYIAPYATFHLEGQITDEGQWGGTPAFQNLETTGMAVLSGIMREEESNLIGMNRTLALGAPDAPTLVDISNDGGTIPQTTTVKVYAVPLTMKGVRRSSVTAGVLISQTVEPIVGASYTRKGFAGQISPVASVTTATDGNNEHVVTATVPVVEGAAGYAWYWGPTVDAGSKLGAITPINSVRITTPVGAGTQAANAAGLDSDNSTDARGIDGFFYLAKGAGQVTPAEATSGAVLETLATGTPGTGTGFTSDLAGGIVEINRQLRTMWELNQVGVDEIWMSTDRKEAARRLIIKNDGAPLVRYNIDANNGRAVTVSGASELVNYTNPFTGETILVRAHPEVPDGVVIGRRLRPIPYNNSGITNPFEMYLQREYFQENWPRSTRKNEMSVTYRGVARGRAMFCAFVIDNVGTTTV